MHPVFQYYTLSFLKTPRAPPIHPAHPLPSLTTAELLTAQILLLLQFGGSTGEGLAECQ